MPPDSSETTDREAVAEIYEDLLSKAVAAERERCAKIADNYGREGDRLSKEFACEVADEIAARIRSET